jgi:hypothetical protein
MTITVVTEHDGIVTRFLTTAVIGGQPHPAAKEHEGIRYLRRSIDRHAAPALRPTRPRENISTHIRRTVVTDGRRTPTACLGIRSVPMRPDRPVATPPATVG